MSEPITPPDAPDFSDGEIDEDDGTYSFRQLYDMIVEKKEIIITIQPDELDALRSGLSMRKTKDNVKLKNAGLEPETNILKFNSYKSKQIEGALDVHIKLAPRQGVKVLSLSVPGPAF